MVYYVSYTRSDGLSHRKYEGQLQDTIISLLTAEGMTDIIFIDEITYLTATMVIS